MKGWKHPVGADTLCVTFGDRKDGLVQCREAGPL